MRIRIVAALVLTMLCAPALLANCQECAEWFDPQSLQWCLYCVPSYCGLFQCDIGQYSGVLDYCREGPAGNDQCFTVNVGCVEEPQALRFDETWRLKGVRVNRSKKTTEPPAAGARIG
jgi:hypothetical protein